MSLNIEAIHNENVKTDIPEFRAGDVQGRRHPAEELRYFQDRDRPQDVRCRRCRTHLPGELSAH